MEQEITLAPEQEEQFRQTIKIGLYKELHRKQLLTYAQLIQLLSVDE